jgi:hypothetical protein
LSCVNLTIPRNCDYTGPFSFGLSSENKEWPVEICKEERQYPFPLSIHYNANGHFTLNIAYERMEAKGLEKLTVIPLKNDSFSVTITANGVYTQRNLAPLLHMLVNYASKALVHVSTKFVENRPEITEERPSALFRSDAFVIAFFNENLIKVASLASPHFQMMDITHKIINSDQTGCLYHFILNGSPCELAVNVRKVDDVDYFDEAFLNKTPLELMVLDN